MSAAFAGVQRQLVQSIGQLRQLRRKLVQGAGQLARRDADACADRRAKPAAPRGRAPGCRPRRRTVPRAWAGSPRHVGAGIGQRDQVAGQVAAVDRRDIGGLQRTQVRRVVPVEEMAAEALQAIPWSPASPPGARRLRACRSSRSRGRRLSTAAEADDWSATSGGRRRAWDPPGSCPAAACCRSAVTNVSKKRQVRRAISRSDRASASEIARLPASAGGTAHPARDRGREQPGEHEGHGDRPAALPAYARRTARPATPMQDALPPSAR